jgi:RIO kinase 1
MAAKLYSDMIVRSFRNDAIYRQGRFIADRRIKKAIDQRSLNGITAQQAMWVFQEYVQLWQLYNAGLPVPKPMVGPSADDMVLAGKVVLMEFIGDEEAAAPRLSDLKLSADDAREAFQQSLEILIQFLKLGKVHGDFSTYNLLWWQSKVIVIDFPQLNDFSDNPDAPMLLEQDVKSLCKSFKRQGIDADSVAVLKEVKARAGFNAAPFRSRA